MLVCVQVRLDRGFRNTSTMPAAPIQLLFAGNPKVVCAREVEQVKALPGSW